MNKNVFHVNLDPKSNISNGGRGSGPKFHKTGKMSSYSLANLHKREKQQHFLSLLLVFHIT